MHETIAVAMSGGVDSSVAAWLLREQGHALLGLTMALFPGCQAGGLSDAAAVAAQLSFPHRTLDLSQAFRAQVMDPFAAAYEQGETPNPCAPSGAATSTSAPFSMSWAPSGSTPLSCR